MSIPEGTTRLIPLTRGQHAIVDEEDYARVNHLNWYALETDRGAFYAMASVGDDWGGLMISLHCLIANPPRGMEVDHIDGNPLNNRRSNLRICTHAQNSRNVRKGRANTSGFKGVSWNKRDKKWSAQIGYEGKLKALGYFDDPILAALAYDKAARKFFGEFAKLNFPTGGQ